MISVFISAFRVIFPIVWESYFGSNQSFADVWKNQKGKLFNFLYFPLSLVAVGYFIYKSFLLGSTIALEHRQAAVIEAACKKSAAECSIAVANKGDPARIAASEAALAAEDQQEEIGKATRAAATNKPASSVIVNEPKPKRKQVVRQMPVTEKHKRKKVVRPEPVAIKPKEPKVITRKRPKAKSTGIRTRIIHVPTTQVRNPEVTKAYKKLLESGK